MIRSLSASALENFINNQNEKDYLIVDVRLHQEYRLDHIPGSVHIPLAQIQFDPYLFEEDKKLIFCCRSGRRSKVAAIFVAETGYKEEYLYNLTGGMVEYTGEILLDYPRIDLFPSDFDIIEFMEKAIDLEKGAFYFYSQAKESLKDTPLYEVMAKMVQAEIAHAKSIFKQLNRIQKYEMGFDLFFDSCNGQILEGGKSIEKVKTLFKDSSSSSHIDILDFAIELEFCAYDLYKVMAGNIAGKQLQNMFYALAQAEKKHLAQIIQALELCEYIS